MRYFSAKDKLRAVREVVIKGRTLKEVSQKYLCSRQILYLWIKKFKKDPARARIALKNGYRCGSNHYKHLSWKLEKSLLDLVVKHPDLSLRGLAGRLNEARIRISLHGVYNVLLRNGLQTRQLRARFSLLHPIKTVLAAAISPANRLKMIEQHIEEGMPIAAVCRIWGISRPTFYQWLARYQEALKRQRVAGLAKVSLVEALLARYKRGYENHRAVSEKVKEAVLAIVRANPAYSVHKIYAEINKEALRLPFDKTQGKRSGSTILPTSGSTIGHHGIQNILSREGLSTFAKRLIFAQGFEPQPKRQVAPLYRPEVPVWRLRMLLSPFAAIPKLMIVNPRAGSLRLLIVILPLFVLGLWFKMLLSPVQGASSIGLFFGSIALFFGLFFFIYSMKYYTSILVILRLAQGGGTASGGSHE